MGGKAHTIEPGDALACAGNALYRQNLPAADQFIERAPVRPVVTLLQNIIVTGGGSRPRHRMPRSKRSRPDDGHYPCASPARDY